MPEIIEVEVIDDPITIEVDIVDFGGLSTSATAYLYWSFLTVGYRLVDYSYDANGILETASVVWPDGSTGTWTTLEKDFLWQTYNSFQITHDASGGVFTQPPYVRNTRGEVTHAPLPTVSGITIQTPALSFVPHKQGGSMTLCAGLDPAAGPENVEFIVPYLETGAVGVWVVSRLFLRVVSPGGAPSVAMEVSTGTGAFSVDDTVGPVTLSPGTYEGSYTPTGVTVTSGNKLRLNFLDVGTALGFTVVLTLVQQ